MNGHGFVPLTLYLQEQVGDCVCPVGNSLLTPGFSGLSYLPNFVILFKQIAIQLSLGYSLIKIYNAIHF